ncbi:MAG: DUF488 family protein [Chloroflexota bacterium]
MIEENNKGMQADGPAASGSDDGATTAVQALRFGHACATRPAEWPPNAHLVLAMRRPRWRTRPVLEAGGRSIPAAGPSDALLNAYLGKPPRGGASAIPDVPKISWEEFEAGYRAEMRTPEGLDVLDQIIRIAQQDPSRPLVVLCWERLDGPAAHPHCHRTVLVDLLEERARERGLAVSTGI